MSNNSEEYDSEDLVVLTDDEGNDITLEFIDRIVCDGGEYAVMIPVDEDDNSTDDAANVVIMRIEHDNDGDGFSAVENEETLNRIFEIFKERFCDKYEFE